MIAKRVLSEKRTSTAAGLVRYIVNAKGGIDPRSWEQTADYILDTHSKANEQGEKVGGVRVTNCDTDDAALATMLIDLTQQRNTRSKAEKTYHLVFSFPPGEQPPLEVLHAIEDELCAAIGFADHQRISAVHIDKEHLHVHVAINKVHPSGFQNIEPFRDMPRLMEACERLEILYGLERTNHGLEKGIDDERDYVRGRVIELGPEQRPGDRDSRFRRYLCQSYNLQISERPEAKTLNGLRNLSSCHMARAAEGSALLLPGDARAGVEQSGEEPAHGLRRTRNGDRADAGAANGLRTRIKDIETQSLEETLAGYVAREAGPQLSEAQSWAQLHQTAAEHGLSIKLRGAGLVIGDDGLDLWIKASSAGRAFSLGNLSKRLGSFAKADADQVKTEPKKRYQQRPVSQSPSSAGLYTLYQRERQAQSERRRVGFAAIRAEHEQLKQNNKRWTAMQRRILKTIPRGASKKIAQAMIRQQGEAGRAANRNAVAARRTLLYADTTLPSWSDWLLQRARRGDVEAHAILQDRQQRNGRYQDILTGTDPEKASQLVRLDFKPRVDRNGNVFYRTADGGSVVDRGKLVQAKSNSIDAALMALEIASKKFDGQPLIVEGSEQFRRDVAMLAGRYNFDVQFADPHMDTIREQNQTKQAVLDVAVSAGNIQKVINSTGNDQKRLVSALDNFLANRNEMRDIVSIISYHRLWTPVDTGQAEYAGRRALEDGSEVLLFERGGETLVKPSSPRVVAKASRWRIGRPVEIDARGRIAAVRRGATVSFDDG